MTDQLSSDLASLRIDREEKPPPSPWLRRLVTLGVLAGLAAAVYSVGVPYLEAQVFKTEVTLTEISLVSPAQASVELTATGYVVPQRTSLVASRLPGTIAKVFVDQGAQVKEGDVLAELDPKDDEASIASAKSRVAAALARARSATATADTRLAELDAAKLRSEREQRLVAQGVAPSGNAEDMKAEVKALERGVEAARAVSRASTAEAAALSAEVKALGVRKGFLTIVSPMSGTVMNKPPQIGEFVGPQPAGIAADMGGFEIADFNSNVVETDVPEARLDLVKVGGPTEIVLDAYPKKRFRGKVREITPSVNRSKATVMVKVEFVDEMEGVLPQMSARVSFLASELDAQAAKEPPKTVIASSAVAERQGAKFAFVFEDGQVRMRPVTLGEPFGSGFVVLQGPSPGTRVVVDPPGTLTDGQKVKEKSEP